MNIKTQTASAVPDKPQMGVDWDRTVSVARDRIIKELMETEDSILRQLMKAMGVYVVRTGSRVLSFRGYYLRRHSIHDEQSIILAMLDTMSQTYGDWIWRRIAFSGMVVLPQLLGSSTTYIIEVGNWSNGETRRE